MSLTAYFSSMILLAAAGTMDMPGDELVARDYVFTVAAPKLVSVCARAFPEQQHQIEAAHASWSSRHAELIAASGEAAVASVPERERASVLARFQAEADGLVADLSGQPLEEMHRQCNGLAKTLRGDM